VTKSEWLFALAVGFITSVFWLLIYFWVIE
jgi:hypothetical protein